MASLGQNINGQFSVMPNTRAYPQIVATQLSQNASTNQSQIRVTYRVQRPNTAWYVTGYYDHTPYAGGEGQEWNLGWRSQWVNFAQYGNSVETVLTYDLWVPHHHDGTGFLDVLWEGDLGTGWGTHSFGGRYDLNTITRATAVSTTAASSVGGTSATVGGNVTDKGVPVCTERGVYWGTTAGSQPNKVASGSGAGAFNVNMSGLERGTQYYFKAYSYNSSGYQYGSVSDFTTTSDIASVTTGTASSVNYNGATVTGSVTDDNGAAVTEKGICFDTSTGPTITDSKVTSGTGEGAISSNLTGLTPNTKYYAKAYATNSQGTGYGGEIEFTTVTAEPTVTTTAGATGLTISTATVGGEVVSGNGSTITERGFVYATTANPTILNSKLVVAGTTGVMSGGITSLLTATLYHFRAYATNANGTGYGSDQTFTTLPGDPSGLSASMVSKSAIDLSWTKGSGGSYTIVRRGATPPSNIDSGTLVYQGTESSCSDTGLSVGTMYYYRAWSATTADWSVAYSGSYSSANKETQYDFIDSANAMVDDISYSTVKTNDGKLSAQISKDGGATWSTVRELTLTASIQTLSFGTGSSDLWDLSLTGASMSDANFRVRLTGGSQSLSRQTYKTFGFSLNAAYILTGVDVQVKAAFDGTDILLYFVKVNPYFGTSPLPIGEGSLAYDTTTDIVTYYNGTAWKGLLTSDSLPANLVTTDDTQTLTNKTLSTGSVIDTNVTVTEVLKKVYPVGCIYISITSTNPATVFGFGTWVAFGAGKTLVGLDSENTAFDTAEETGGVETVTLTSAQSGVPAHNHGNTGNQSADHTHNTHVDWSMKAGTGGYGYFTGASSDARGNATDGVSANHTHAVGNNTAANAAEAHTNLQPYIVTYMFKRTA